MDNLLGVIKSRRLKQYAVFILLFMFQCFLALGQVKNVGLPFINNYTREQYHAETQNWDIDQDEKGIMYFANNQGLLVFNGNSWKTYPLSNNSIVRSVLADKERIYAGGYNEFGYFEANGIGELEYKSLSMELGTNNKDFDEVWRIHKTSEGIIFQSYLNVFIYDGKFIRVLDPRSRFGFSYFVNDTLFVIDREFGIYTLSNNRLIPYYLDDKFFVRNEIPFIQKGKGNTLLMATSNNGIYMLNQNKISRWESEVNNYFIQNQIYSGVALAHNQLAVGTIQNGVYIIDFDGNIVMHLNRQRGLQNNTVLSLFSDKFFDLWLGFDNGIAMLEVNSPITLLDYSHNIETSYCMVVFKNRLYVGTNQGLFSISMDDFNNKTLYSKNFEIIKGTLGQVWKLNVIDNKLFCGHNFGTFLIDGEKAGLVSEKPGGWDYEQPSWSSDMIIEGNYHGLVLYTRSNSNKSWVEAGFIEGFKESCKEIMFDDRKTLWVEHGIKGLFKLSLSADGRMVESVKQFLKSDGLPNLPYSLVKIKGKVYVLAENLLYEYSYEHNKFFEVNMLSQLIQEVKNITKIVEAQNGDLWVFSQQSISVLRQQEDGSFTVIKKPFFRIKGQFIKGSFENVTWESSQNTFIGGQTGLIHYSTQVPRSFEPNFNVYLSKVNVMSRKNGSENESNNGIHLILNPTSNNASIAYKNNSISFEYFAPFFEASSELQYATRLKGFDNKWSEWSIINYKEYNNLREGKYVFEVKAKNIYETESPSLTYEFSINPPFYRLPLAYILYILLVASIIVINIIYFRLKIIKTRQIEEVKLANAKKAFKQEVKISEQKIEQLEQEKMKTEMQLKNIELANSTMNLIQKNKLLSSIKKELTNVTVKAKSDQVKTDIKQLISKIDRDISHDQNLKVFDKYFDRVHQDFINRLRDKHPQLSARDIRLCAYLRMNLSTKEIAPLMNVSTRGLEISRYRLRKKLDIERDINLVDYIMTV